MARTPKVRIESIRQPGHFKDVELVYADILTKLKLYRRVDLTPKPAKIPAKPVSSVVKAEEPTKPKRVYKRRDMQAEEGRSSPSPVVSPWREPPMHERNKPQAE